METTFRAQPAINGEEKELVFVTDGQFYRCGDCGADLEFTFSKESLDRILEHAKNHAPTLIKLVDVDFIPPHEIEDPNEKEQTDSSG